MKSVSAELALHLAQETTSLCRLLKITRADGTVFYLTDFDNDLTYNEAPDALIVGSSWTAQSVHAAPWFALYNDAMSSIAFVESGISTFTYIAASGSWADSVQFNGYGGMAANFEGTTQYNPKNTLQFEAILSLHYDSGGAGGTLRFGLANGAAWAGFDSFIGFENNKSSFQPWGTWHIRMGDGGPETAIDIDTGVTVVDGARTSLKFISDGTNITWYINGSVVCAAPVIAHIASNLNIMQLFTSTSYSGSLFERVESMTVYVPTPSNTYLCGLTESDGNAGDSGPGGGLTFTAVEIKADGSPNNSQVTGFLTDSCISEHDVRAHLYDNATFELRAVNWSDLTMGDLKLLSGTIGDIEMKNGQYQMELRGWTQKLTTTCGSLYGPNCRAELFGGGIEGIDPTNHWKCRLNRADWVQSGVVGSSPDLMTIVPTIAGSPAVTMFLMVGSSTPTDVAPAGWFDHGVITFTSGALVGYSFEIAVWDGLVLSLYAATPIPFAVSPGDTFEIEPGCDKTPNTCHGKFSNIVNFAGEANIPGLNVIGAVSRPQVPD